MTATSSNESESWLRNHGGGIALASLIITLSATSIAGLQLLTSTRQYNATEKQRVIDNQLAQRQQFLKILNSLSEADLTLNRTNESFKDSENLGSMQASLQNQLLMQLLQAEALLPEMERDKLVTHAEYLLLANHSAMQGFNSKAESYCKLAFDSDNPNVKSHVLTIRGGISYQQQKRKDALNFFDDAIQTYEDAKKLTEQEREAGITQVYVTWTDLEIDYGDMSLERAKELIKEGRVHVAKLRAGPLKESAEKFFQQREKEIEDRSDKRPLQNNVSS